MSKEALGDFGVIFLPPYSPDLNPIERLGRLTRRFCTHNKYLDCLDELAATVLGFFEEHAAPNEAEENEDEQTHDRDTDF